MGGLAGRENGVEEERRVKVRMRGFELPKSVFNKVGCAFEPQVSRCQKVAEQRAGELKRYLRLVQHRPETKVPGSPAASASCA